MSKPVVLLAEQLSPATVDALGPDFEVRQVDGTDRPALLEALAEANAILVRSATQVDAEAIAAAPNLKIIARAGVGLDNVDTPAATKAGVMVVNAPTSNITSAAELAVGHIISLARHIPNANASMKAGDWKRSKYTGVELFEKTVGIVGLGRIGTLVVDRLKGFGVTLVAYDPYVTPARASQLGVQLLSLEELMAQSDFITIHIPRTPETTGLIGDAEFALAKPELRIVNCSRGGIIDENALRDALESGKIAGAALDVFVTEPPSNRDLLDQPNLQLTPHLGASTDEAQEKAGVSVARSVRLALAGELVPDAVNVAGGVIDEYVRPGIPLMEKLGQFLQGLIGASPVAFDIEVHGELARYEIKALRLAALKGFFTNMVTEQVSYVNAPLLAEERGLEVRMNADEDSDEYRNVLTLRATLSDGKTVSVSGTLTGPKQIEKLVGINGYSIEVPLANHHLVMIYSDRPGVVAVYGAALGDAGVNIAGMQIARDEEGGQALSVLTIDDPASDELLAKLRDAIGASELHEIDIIES
ncbi:phosphoglycerate dehydrogenase [Pseudoclavibacter sp. RFBG4]|uniref:phosphoglycerate dehydrogenase n=1 Tax=Pseudoclavibacter sp. RFBG4 TaxID=2080575 RepID=UPI000CE8D9FA|nr:phosphoglycerate dehydrogenase [Pseudoclavibacter sp. RFBG4]PPG35355.1 phosphoglycerate dehydrogenase [Pseudoclavibacter sp. RFBG4]